MKILKEFPEEIIDIKQIDNIKGIGDRSIARIDEILKTGKLSEIREDVMNNDYQKYIEELENVYGIGRKTALELFNKYKIKSIDDLKALYNAKKITLPDSIILGLKYHGVYQEHIPRKEINEINIYLQRESKMIDKDLIVIICGSYRREKPFSNDIDVLITHPKLKTLEQLHTHKSYMTMFLKKLINDGFIADSITNPETDTKYYGIRQMA